MEAPYQAVNLEGAVVASISAYKGKRDVIIVRLKNGFQLLLDSGRPEENAIWLKELKADIEQIVNYRTAKLIKERQGSEKWLLKVREKYDADSGAPISPEGLIAIQKVEEEIQALDKSILEIKDKVAKAQEKFQEAASHAAAKHNEDVCESPVLAFKNSIFTNRLFEGTNNGSMSFDDFSPSSFNYLASNDQLQDPNNKAI